MDTDTTEIPQRAQVELDAGRPIYTTEQMRELYTVEAFSAPFVVVRRKEDGVRGTLIFTHAPRFYFGWVPA